MSVSQDEMKKNVGYKAVDDYVKSGMLVGLGTGSTVYFAVERLGEKLKSGELKDIVGIPTSERTREQAESLGIPLITLDQRSDIDVAIDGADEVDPKLSLVKGRGGALLREKQIEECAKEFIVIVDQSKIQDGLGTDGAMPVEVNKFCCDYLRAKVADLPALKGVKGLKAELRKNKDGSLYETDNQNYIVDLYMDSPIPDIKECGRQLKSLTGVIEHGLFIDMASACLVGQPDGSVVLKTAL
uniref:ribose-5-phosphate isomerase n=1 Tax=Chromera velia CCMP2878 TaxID=1169474 RepID=A0A0G4HCG5_9ALVE|eukprot:Cvel_26177.t1-p1 / transcript=Cvel_26177.t1 / gene=Cvel_26177 / organism=Chromera_velia_CCMP2878 / gene_product=Probable ribose-5-phosphate isomerase, putative / transcript_product=Probable ribose-5-phosphate isomerase, putative / location=Cvel_scaffold3076:11787-13933(+) / protein_length=241 / sequence_SO=supercontig / SO=protein_coding / is_pseudo=false